jgi:hypothetical protein
MFVDPQVVNPEFLYPGFFDCGFAFKEQEFGFDALGLKDAGRKAP